MKPIKSVGGWGKGGNARRFFFLTRSKVILTQAHTTRINNSKLGRHQCGCPQSRDVGGRKVRVTNGNGLRRRCFSLLSRLLFSCSLRPCWWKLSPPPPPSPISSGVEVVVASRLFVMTALGEKGEGRKDIPLGKLSCDFLPRKKKEREGGEKSVLSQTLHFLDGGCCCIL